MARQVNIPSDDIMALGDKAAQQKLIGTRLKLAGTAFQDAWNIYQDIVDMRLTNMATDNKKVSLENQMLAIDNEVEYYKNQIAEKFNQTMARNAVTMAAKNLRVTASNLLEKTKDAAYDATKDIQMLESNAELKKIGLRSEQQQAEVARKLSKTLLVSDIVKNFASLGLSVASGASDVGGFGNLLTADSSKFSLADLTGSLLDEAVYGG